MPELGTYGSARGGSVTGILTAIEPNPTSTNSRSCDRSVFAYAAVVCTEA